MHFTERAERVLRLAHEGAAELGHSHVGTEHLLLGLSREGDGIAARTLVAYGMTPTRLGELLRENVGVGAPTLRTPQGLTPRARQSIEQAAAEAAALGHAFVGAEHLLLGVLRENDCLANRILLSAGIEPQKLYDMALRFSGSPASGNVEPFAFSGGAAAASPSRSRGDTRTLNQFSRDLTQSARDGLLDPVIGREPETDRVVAILTRRQKNNPVLIGEPGVGKTAVAEGLARRLAEGRVPDVLKGRRLVSLDLAGMIAGTKYRGEFEERVRAILEEARKAANVILFIDELHTVVGAGAAEGAIDAANILKPALSRGELRVVGATTIAEYRKYIERDAALERRFQPVMLEEPTPKEARAILEGLRPRYETHHGLRISDEALDAAVSLSIRYLPDRFLPDKAVDLIDEAAASTRMRLLGGSGMYRKLEDDSTACERELEDAVNAADFTRAAAVREKKKAIEEKLARERTDNLVTLGVVTAEDVAHACASWTRIPVEQLTQEEESRLANLENILRERVVGQDEAVAAVAKAVRRGRVGLADPNRPVGSFLFLGPSGVGKTETARALAEALFGDENALIRFDMSEYAEKHTISRLIGSPPGYVGHEEGGQLTGKVRAKPYSIILFDELEKAHSDIFHLMLQILEDGRLTDAQGRRADFRNTVVIMTSNLGAGSVAGTSSPVGFSDIGRERAKEDRVRGEMRAFFRPEFLNRLDAAVVFHVLDDAALREIARRLLTGVAKRFREKGYTLTWDDDAIVSLSREGSDTRYGARPIRRAINSRVEEPAAEAILTGTLSPGMEAHLCGDTLRFLPSPDKPQ
ncbi:MAG: ATP-dependent Clp protease ATP-binding subunit [Clostridiaceae bacterium]|nr:ATP-dependent Clp protease ATP-binding subunit [Clostridiaceae bacterium]